jgi:hypothetical protein
MSDPRLRRYLPALVAAVAFVAWYLYWCSPRVQAPRTFARIRAGIEEGSAGAVIDQLHPGYSIKDSWPNQLADYGDLVSPGALRAFAQQGLNMMLRAHADDPLLMSYDLHRIEALADGTVQVDASIQFSTRSGRALSLIDPPLVHKRFILSRASSIFLALSIKSHEAFTVCPCRRCMALRRGGRACR